MPIDIDARYRNAVQYVWTHRLRQKEKQVEAGKIDAGNRGAVTGGGHMGAIELLVKDLLIEFGIDESDIFTKKKRELPGTIVRRRNGICLSSPGNNWSRPSNSSQSAVPMATI